jgi:transposase
MNTKLRAICDSQGRPLNLFVTAGQVSAYIGARASVRRLPDVDWLLGDRGYDADWLKALLKDKGIRPCISGRKQRTTIVRYDKRRYKRRNRPSREIALQWTAGQRCEISSAD